MLVSQRDDHRRNFYRTRDIANTLEHAINANQPLDRFGPSLLRFYAAESGLKYLLNRVKQVPFEYEVKDQNLPLDTEAGFPGRVEGYSHDLPRMLARLKVSAASVSIPPGPFRVIQGYRSGQTFECKAAHEAWRYGLETEPNDQMLLDNFLTNVIAYIETEIL